MSISDCRSKQLSGGAMEERAIYSFNHHPRRACAARSVWLIEISGGPFGYIARGCSEAAPDPLHRSVWSAHAH